MSGAVALIFFFCAFVRVSGSSITCGTTVTPSDTVLVDDTAPVTVNATIAVGGTLDITILVNVSNYPPQLIDIYFLWENSYPCRTFSAQFWQSGAHRLYYPLIYDMQAANPYLAFGLGFYTTKRLAGLGTRRAADTYKTDFVFQPVCPLIDHASFIDSNMIPETWAASRAASNISSGLEALLDVLMGADTNPLIGFRAGSRRIIIQAACSQVGVAGDVAPRLLMTNPVELPTNVPFPPPNLYDGLLDNTCKIRGQVCTDACGVITSSANPNTLPDATCGGCGLKSGVVSALNITQFNYGSCTDYPSVTGFITTVRDNVSTPYEFIAFVPNVTIGGVHTDHSADRNSAFFQTLIDAVFVAPGVRSYVINNTIDLASYIQNAYPISIEPPTVQVVPIIPAGGLPGDFVSLTPVVSGITCNLTLCVYTVTLNYTEGGDGTFEVIFNGDSNSAVIIGVDNCHPPTKSQSSSHHTQSRSTSQLSKSQSNSHSASQHSPSKSKSHHSRSKSTSHHSPSKSKSHDSRSHSKSHHSPSESQSHHLKSHSVSHHSDSNSKSHHSQSRSKSHQSHSESKSHNSRSHSKSHHSRSKSHHSHSQSKSHHSRSKSESHHSHSESKSHQSRSHSKSHHSPSQSQSHHLKSHSVSHHSHSHSRSASHHSASHSKSHHSKSRSASHHSSSQSKSHHSSSLSQSKSHESRSASHHTTSHESNSLSAKHPASRRGNHTAPAPALTTTDIITISTVIPFIVLIACCCCCIPLILEEGDDDDEERRRRRRRLLRGREFQ